MKVLIITSMYPTADNPAYGAFVKAQVDNLRSAGVDLDVMVISPRTGGRRSLESLTKYLRAVPDIRRRIASQRVDLVHAHFTYCGVVALTQRTAPVVVTFHGDDVLGTIGRDGRPTLLSRTVLLRLTRMVARRASASIVQSDEMRRRLGDPSAQVIPCEIDLDVFRPVAKARARRTLGLSQSTRYLLFAASPDIPVKNFAVASEVAGVLAARRDDTELLVVHREPQERFALYLNACDVLVFPSIQEGSPNVVKQAMACNLPIVATDVGDVRSVIDGAVNCHIARATVEAFVERIDAVLEDGRRSDGSVHVARFAPSPIAAALMDVYRGALAPRASHHSLDPQP